MARIRWRLKGSQANKYNAQKTRVDGHLFDSKMEAEYYEILKSQTMIGGQIQHIDVHPVMTLPGGIRYKPDFMIYWVTSEIEVIDVKGVMTKDFKIKRKLFDETHPLAPLVVVQKRGGEWREI